MGPRNGAVGTRPGPGFRFEESYEGAFAPGGRTRLLGFRLGSRLLDMS